MKPKINPNRFLAILPVILLLSLVLCTPGFALPENNILNLTASYSGGKVTISGETSPGVLAVAILIYDTNGTTLLRMETFGVTEEVFSAKITINLPAGTYTVKAADYEGGLFATTTFKASAPFQDSDGSRNSSGGSSPAPTYTAQLKAGTKSTALQVNVDAAAQSCLTSLEAAQLGELLHSTASPVITMPSIPGVQTYTLELPVAALTKVAGTKDLTLSTDVASMLIPANMLNELTGKNELKAGITIGPGDKTGLSEEEIAAIGARPLIQLKLTLNGVDTPWHNQEAPVTVAIPYKPTSEELENPESIIIWYLDGSGKPVCIPSGQYDPAIGQVIFTTTHFSSYGVGYEHITFKDVAATAWYSQAITFIASREITTGMGNGNFSPQAKLSRGEFIVMLMKAYELKPELSPQDNFLDGGNTYYTNYLAAAKALGISKGVGDNLFLPQKEITRQEMFTLLFNALKVIDRLPQGTAGKPLTAFNDGDKVASWAKEALTLLAETETISGNNGHLYPLATTTRAEMAQVIYNLLSK